MITKTHRKGRLTHYLDQPSSEDVSSLNRQFHFAPDIASKNLKRPQYGRVRDPIPTLSLSGL
jgi:hypothetical protein